MSSSFRRSRSPASDYSKHSLLAKVEYFELSKLKVSIKRGDVIATGPVLPLEREIVNPKDIFPCVHVRKASDKPPQIPIFGRGIKVNQDFSEDRKVFTQHKHHRSSRRSRSKRRSRSRSVGNRSGHSRSRDRSRRSREKEREPRSSSRTRRSTSRGRSSSYEREYARGRRRYRDRSSGRLRKSRSISLSPSKHESYCPMYKPQTRRRSRSIIRSRRKSRSISPPARRRSRSITPLRPGEYRPGHPDLAFRKLNRKPSSRSGSPRNTSKDNEPLSSTVRQRRSPEKSRSPHRVRSRRSTSRERFNAMAIPGMEYGFYDGFAPIPMGPYRGRFPIVYPRMYPPGMMMPRLVMPPLARMPFRPRWPVYNSGASKPHAPKPATITSTEAEESVEQAKDNGNGHQDVSSSDRPTSNDQHSQLIN